MQHLIWVLCAKAFNACRNFPHTQPLLYLSVFLGCFPPLIYYALIINQPLIGFGLKVKGAVLFSGVGVDSFSITYLYAEYQRVKFRFSLYGDCSLRVRVTTTTYLHR